MQTAKQGIYNIIFITEDLAKDNQYQRVVMATSLEHAQTKIEKEMEKEIDIIEWNILGETEEEYPVNDDDQATIDSITEDLDKMIHSGAKLGDLLDTIANKGTIVGKMYLDVLRTYEILPEFEKEAE